jgi:hypothetical protein
VPIQQQQADCGRPQHGAPQQRVQRREGMGHDVVPCEYASRSRWASSQATAARMRCSATDMYCLMCCRGTPERQSNGDGAEFDDCFTTFGRTRSA